MSVDRRLRTPLTVGLLAVTATFGLVGCVPTVEEDSGGSGQNEEAAAPETPQETQAEEQPAEESSSDESSASSDDSSSASEESSDDASEDSGGAAPAGGGRMADATALSGDPIEVVEGEGGGTVDVPEHDEPLVVVFENKSDEEFSYIYGTADPGQSLEGADSGETVTFLLDPYGYSGGLESTTRKWTMEADEGEAYKISFYPMDSIPTVADGEGAEAEGYGLFRLNLEDDGYFAVKHDGESNFIVEGESPEDTGNTSQLAFNEIGKIDGGLEVEDGEYIITVNADGKWSFSPISEEDYESDYEPVEE
ncbi:hypothetical protein [Kocuria palustris]|uniref:hypothetical protein n=1 Tax=Kocuria palustris TaxID=71999 RepID=UPI00119F9743|nr:hypothetical protein [Kocuria palustris]